MPVVLLLATAWATNPWTPRDVHSAETRAMGYTGGAMAQSNAGITVNPATLALAERYDVVAMGHYGDNEAWGAGVTLTDSRTVPIALGLAYHHDVWEPALLDEELPGWTLPGKEVRNWKTSDAFTLAVAYPFLDRRLTIGMAVHLTAFNTQRNGLGVGGNGHLGITARPWEHLVLGLSVRNLVPINDELAPPTTLRPAVRLEHNDIGALAFEADIQLIGEVLYAPVSLYSGLEGRIVVDPQNAGVVALRAGYRSRWLEDHYITAGIGLINAKASVDYALELDVSDDEITLSSFINSLSIRIGF